MRENAVTDRGRCRGHICCLRSGGSSAAALRRSAQPKALGHPGQRGRPFPETGGQHVSHTGKGLGERRRPSGTGSTAPSRNVSAVPARLVGNNAAAMAHGAGHIVPTAEAAAGQNGGPSTAAGTGFLACFGFHRTGTKTFGTTDAQLMVPAYAAGHTPHTFTLGTGTHLFSPDWKSHTAMAVCRMGKG